MLPSIDQPPYRLLVVCFFCFLFFFFLFFCFLFFVFVFVFVFFFHVEEKRTHNCGMDDRNGQSGSSVTVHPISSLSRPNLFSP